MRITTFAVSAVLALSIGICTGQTPEHKKETPKKARKEKPIRRGTFVFILPVLDHTGAQKEESSIRSLYARAGMLNAFSRRKLEIVPRIIAQGLEDQAQIDVSTTDNWTSENLDKLAQGAECQYIAAAELTALQSSETGSKRDPFSARAAVDISAWLYDVKNHEFLLQNEKSHCVYSARKGDDKLDQKAINYQAIIDAADRAFKTASLKSKKS